MTNASTTLEEKIQNLPFMIYKTQEWKNIFNDVLDESQKAEFEGSASQLALLKALKEMGSLVKQHAEAVAKITQESIEEEIKDAFAHHTSSSSGTQSADKGPAKPKLSEPPIFSGSDGKIKFTEWMDKILIWIDYQELKNDKDKITLASARLTGAATKYVLPWTKKIISGKPVDWDEFIKDLKRIYGQRNTEEGHKEEFDEFVKDTGAARRDFISHMEKFRTLAELSQYDDKYIINKLNKLLDSQTRVVIITSQTNAKNTFPTKWREYLEKVVEIHKAFKTAREDVYDEVKREPKEQKSDDPKPKKKPTTRNTVPSRTYPARENSARRTDKWCTRCERNNHNTDECFFTKRDEKKKKESEKEHKVAGPSKPADKPSFKKDFKKDFKGKSRAVRAAKIESDDDRQYETPNEQDSAEEVEELLEERPK